METNQRVIVEQRDFMGEVTGTVKGIFKKYIESDLVIELESGKITFVKKSCVFESEDTYNRAVARRNQAPIVEIEKPDYDWYEL